MPITDLPEHVAGIATLARWGDPHWNVAQFYELSLLKTQYVLYYLVAAALTDVVGSAERANLILLSLVGLGFPYGLRALLRASGRDERLAIFACPLFWSPPVVTGFFNYVAALPLALFGWALVVRQISAPGRRRAFALCLLGALMFFLHLLVVVVWAMGAVLLVAFVRPAAVSARRPLRFFAEFARAVWWLAPVAAGLVMWALTSAMVHTDRDFSAGTLPGLSYMLFTPLWRGVLLLPFRMFDVWRGPGDDWIFLWLCASAVPLVWAARKRAASPTSRGLWALWGLALFLYFALPFSIGHTSFLNDRFALLVALLSPLLLHIPRGFWSGAVPLGCAAAAAMAAGMNATRHALLFDAESGAFDQLIEKTAPHKRLLSLIFDSESRFTRFPGYVHFAGYYRARKGGVATMSFAELPHIPVRFRVDAAPPPRAFGWEWRPCDFRNHHDGPYYDYVLTRGAIDPFASHPPGPVFRLVESAPPWALYERVPGERWDEVDVNDPGPCANTGSAR